MSGDDRQGLDLGSLNDVLGNANPYRNVMGWVEGEDEFRKQFPATVEELHAGVRTGVVNLMRSAGPVSDFYILSRDPAALIVGPSGSGKTIASCKKALVNAKRIRPGPDGVRRYVLGTWRQKYINVWQATIPSWWKLFPRELFPKWAGASPRQAEHTIEFEDKHGRILLINRFRAFGEVADPEDVLGNEFTDCWLNEWSTLPEELFIALVDRVGRDPPAGIIKRAGRFFGDSNAPDVLNYVYRDFFEQPKEGYKLYLQPSGLSEHAENLDAVGREYYENSARMNSHRPWWVRRMIHAMPGYARANDPVYPKFDDLRNLSTVSLMPIKELPVIDGCDGGLTPASAYFQEMPNGQMRVLAEVTLQRGGMRELATAKLALEESRFRGCQFITVCDPAMGAGEDTEESSDRARLARYLGREVELAPTQELGARIDAVNCKFDLTLDEGLPGLIVDPSCKVLRRGFNQTFHFHQVAGTNDRGNIAKTFDGHVHEALQYGALLCGSSQVRRRVGDREVERKQRRERNRQAGRYNPVLRRWA
jgi:hypothetical protein